MFRLLRLVNFFSGVDAHFSEVKVILRLLDSNITSFVLLTLLNAAHAYDWMTRNRGQVYSIPIPPPLPVDSDTKRAEFQNGPLFSTVVEKSAFVLTVVVALFRASHRCPPLMARQRPLADAG